MPCTPMLCSDPAVGLGTANPCHAWLCSREGGHSSGCSAAPPDGPAQIVGNSQARRLSWHWAPGARELSTLLDTQGRFYLQGRRQADFAIRGRVWQPQKRSRKKDKRRLTKAAQEPPPPVPSPPLIEPQGVFSLQPGRPEAFQQAWISPGVANGLQATETGFPGGHGSSSE